MQATKRQSSIKVTNKKLEKIGYRILQLTCLEAKVNIKIINNSNNWDTIVICWLYFSSDDH